MSGFAEKHPDDAEMLAAVMNRVRGAVFRAEQGPDGPMRCISEGILELTGHAVGRFLEGGGLLFSDIISPADAVRRREEINASMKASRRWDLEYRITNVQGEVRFFREQGHTVPGEATVFEGLVTDITDRRRGGKEEQFALLVHSVKDYAIFMLDPKGRVRSWNKGAQRIKGYTEAEILGRHFSVFYPPGGEEQAERELEEARAKGSATYEGWRVRRDGSRYFAQTLLTAMRDSDGKLVGFAKVTRDLSERMEAERDAERLRQIADVVPAIVWVRDHEGRETYLNQRWTGYTGQSLEEALGEGTRKYVHPEDADRADSLRVAAYKDGKPFENELRIRGRDGTYRWFLSKGTPIRDETGRVSAFFGTTIDVDQRVKTRMDLEVESKEGAKRREELEEAVEQRTWQLQETIRDLEAFSYTASHDLRAPLRAIEGYAFMLERDLGPGMDKENRDRLRRLGQAARRMDTLISDLLVFAAIPQAELKIEKVDLEPLVKELLTHDEFRTASVKVDGPLGSLQGQRSMVYQALHNLLVNAVKFTRPGEPARVRVWTTVREGKVRVNVKDEGIGVEPALVERIFRPFERGHSGGYAGTGIGLSIVKKSIERLGGRVGVESEHGKGSTFWIELPEIVS